MARLALRKICIVEVQIPDERTVPERGPIGCRPTTTTDQRHDLPAAELDQLPPDRSGRLGVERADRTSEAVEHPNLQRSHRVDREIVPGGANNERGELVALVPGHTISLPRPRLCDLGNVASL
jgi:hypothetical protein